MNLVRAIIFAILLLTSIPGNSQKDTLYFDQSWQLCNPETANYYRVGTLDSTYDKIFFRGPVFDHYINGELEMEGNYSLTGDKDGSFTFYYPGGKIKAKGAFRSNSPDGSWEFYYPGGKPEQEILFSGIEESFTVINYIDSSGQQQCKDGTGDFTLYLTDNSTRREYQVKGSSLKGKRNDAWKYFFVSDYERKQLAYKEVYKEGVLKNTVIYYSFGRTATYKEAKLKTRFPFFDRFFTTEKFTRVIPNPIVSLNEIEYVAPGTQVNDTVYFNNNWQICEKPFAEYYRLGTVNFDTIWSYVGAVRDFSKKDMLLMDGSYTTSGKKEGQFNFYFPNGKPEARGSFIDNKPSGKWEFFYANGQKKGTVDFNNENDNFTVLDFSDSLGHSYGKDGSCVFEFSVTTDWRTHYLIKGEFTNGLRSGIWKFYWKQWNRLEGVMIKETYIKGVLKKGLMYSGRAENIEFTIPTKVNFDFFEKFVVTEDFSKDPNSFTYYQFDNDLRDMLIKKKAPGVNVSGNSVGESLEKLVKKLNERRIIILFNEAGKIYNGTIEFRVSDSGYMKEIEISGNLSQKEHDDLLFILKKFERIEQQVIGTVLVDAYYKIFFFTVDVSDMLPRRYRNDPAYNKIFMFTPLALDETKEILKKIIKDYFRYFY